MPIDVASSKTFTSIFADDVFAMKGYKYHCTRPSAIWENKGRAAHFKDIINDGQIETQRTAQNGQSAQFSKTDKREQIDETKG